jgi:phosphoglucomutase
VDRIHPFCKKNALVKREINVYTLLYMANEKEINDVLGKMILSASGWRGIFSSCGNEEGTTDEIDKAHRLISAAAAYTFAEYLRASSANSQKVLVLLGTDTRPTGKAIANAMIPVLLALGCDVQYAGVTAAPEIMAWARKYGLNGAVAGFVYVSASHNPIGHNGIKFGLADGGVLAAEETGKLIVNFRSFLEKDDFLNKIESLVSAAGNERIQKVYSDCAQAKKEAFDAYYNFCGDVAWGSNVNGAFDIAAVIKNSIAEQPLGIVCDFNGSARTVSIDRDFFTALGLKFECINSEPGQIVHRIVPEGESLEPCRLLVKKAHERDASFMLGYVPDCDGDRGNLVIWDDSIKKARSLEAQEVFALACVAELSYLVWTGGLSFDNGKPLAKAAVTVNDPTSMRIDRIAEAFGASVFRAEVGEANVVGLARRLREQGYIVRILGEGSAGGNITHPSAVRDPVHTVLAIVKLLALRSIAGKPGLFEIWCEHSGQSEKYRDDFTLADIIASLPQFVSTSAYSESAVLRIKTEDHALLKDRYQEIFLREWEEQKDKIKTYGICCWEAIAYNGMNEKRNPVRFGEAGRGGFKISFKDGAGREIAFIWMRGSATEPVFRIMADTEGFGEKGRQFERFLLDWQRCMIVEADNSNKE